MNNAEYVIDKDVSMPPKKGTGRLSSPLSIALSKMEVGDSVLMNQRERNSAFAMAKTHSIKLASRRTNDAIDQIRVWRTA